MHLTIARVVELSTSWRNFSGAVTSVKPPNRRGTAARYPAGGIYAQRGPNLSSLANEGFQRLDHREHDRRGGALKTVRDVN